MRRDPKSTRERGIPSVLSVFFVVDQSWRQRRANQRDMEAQSFQKPILILSLLSVSTVSVVKFEPERKDHNAIRQRVSEGFRSHIRILCLALCFLTFQAFLFVGITPKIPCSNTAIRSPSIR